MNWVQRRCACMPRIAPIGACKVKTRAMRNATLFPPSTTVSTPPSSTSTCRGTLVNRRSATAARRTWSIEITSRYLGLLQQLGAHALYQCRKPFRKSARTDARFLYQTIDGDHRKPHLWQVLPHVYYDAGLTFYDTDNFSI